MENQEIPKECNTVDVKKVTESAVVLAEQYETYEVSTNEEFEAGADHLKGIKDAQKTVEEERKKITQPLYEAQKATNDFFKQFSSRLSDAERNIKNGLLAYQSKKEAEEREAQRIANKKAEKERQRLAKLAEAAEKRGDEAKAETFRDREQSTMAAPVATKAPPKVKGISTQEVWSWEIEDFSKIPDAYKTVDEKKLNGVVRAMKGDTEIPGVKVFPKQQMSARGR